MSNDDATHAPPAAELLRSDKTRRARLIATARALFFERGYTETRIIDMAKGAGFSKRTVYLEFQSKDEVFAAICEEGLELLLARLTEAVTPDAPASAILVKLADAYLGFFREHQPYFRLLLRLATDETFAKVPAGSFERLQKQGRACIECIAAQVERARNEGVMRPNLDPWNHAVMAWAALTGCLSAGTNVRRIDMGGLSVESLYWQCFDSIMRGISTDRGLVDT